MSIPDGYGLKITKGVLRRYERCRCTVCYTREGREAGRGGPKDSIAVGNQHVTALIGAAAAVLGHRQGRASPGAPGVRLRRPVIEELVSGVGSCPHGGQSIGVAKVSCPYLYAGTACWNGY